MARELARGTRRASKQPIVMCTSRECLHSTRKRRQSCSLSGSYYQGVIGRECVSSVRVKCACQVCDGAERCAERCALVSREVVSFFLRSDGHLLHIALEKQGLFLKSYPLCVST